jgi:hypothetical protein
MRKWLFGIGAAFVGLFSAAYAQQAPVPTHTAPQAWVRYAGLVEKALEDRLTGDSDQAKRLRVYFSGSASVTTITLSVWVDPKGVVSRVVFAPFLDHQANADLSDLLQATKLAVNPPADILLPIRLNLHMTPSPEKSSPSGVASANPDLKPD